MNNPPSQDLIGQLIGEKYKLLSRLDSTGHARVYKAEQMHLGRVVALKLGGVRLAQNDPSFERLSRTARMAAKVQHPRIAAVYDVGKDPRGYVYLAMEMCSGTDLRKRVNRLGPLPLETCAKIARQVLDGLGAAHLNGVIHGGLSPKYVMVREESSEKEGNVVSVKLVGFGLSEWDLEMMGENKYSQHERRKIEGMGFVAPEIIEGSRPNERSDLYSAAVLLFFLMTGQLPWEEGSLDMQEARRWYEHRVRYALEDSPVAESLVDFFGVGLAPLPQDRFESAFQMKEAFNRALSGQKKEYSQISQRQETFGRFRLLRMLARGGMGELHLAVTEMEMGQAHTVALKTLRPDFAANKDFLDLFLKEARLTSRLSHPNLVGVHEVGKITDRYYMTLEFVVGKDARRILDRAKTDNMPVPIEVAVYIVRELCEGLAYTHRIQTPSGLGVVHADVSPTNVLVSFEGGVKLIDFGLAQRVKISTDIEKKKVLGKLCYLAPEQLVGETLDARTDIFAAGLLLFELLTGSRYHRGETEEEIRKAIIGGAIVPPSKKVMSIPGALDNIVCKALAKNREERYKKTEAMRDDLSEVLSRLRPRMSRDFVASYLRQLFPSEYKTETQLSWALFSKTPEVTVETAISLADLADLSGGMEMEEEEVTLPAYSIRKRDIAEKMNRTRDRTPETLSEIDGCLDKTASMSLEEMRTMGVFSEDGAEHSPHGLRFYGKDMADTDPGISNTGKKAVHNKKPSLQKDKEKLSKGSKKKRKSPFFDRHS